MRNFLLGLMLLVPVAASAAPAAVSVAPMKASGEHVAFPRLTAFPDPAVQARVNAILAKREAEEHSYQRDCLKQVLDEHKDKRFFDWFTDVEVTYLSGRFLSLQINSGWYCAGAHPDSGQAPITIDLRTGTLIDWTKMFKPGVLNTVDKPAPNKGRLGAIYLARYIARNSKNDPDDCIGTLRNDDFLEPAIRLDAKSGGLMVWPHLAHVVAACGDDIAIPPDQLASLVTDPALVEDIRAMIQAKR
jgi:hypothetical protein